MQNYQRMNMSIVNALGIEDKDLTRLKIELDPNACPKIVATYESYDLKTGNIEQVIKNYELREKE